jgi:F-type H+-transporting ATPase subunit b
MLIDWFTVGAQALNFVVLVWLMKRFLYKPVLDAIGAREKKIAAELADADRRKAEAQKAQDEFRQRNEEFDNQRAALLKKATDEATAEHKRLLDEARKAADGLSARRQAALRADAKSLNQAIGQRIQQEVFAVARRVLTDLATTSLEERMSEIFIQRLTQMEGQAKVRFGDALRSASEPALVRSAFELPAGQRAAIQNALHETFSADIQVRYETRSDLVSGIELSASGQRVGWSVAGYLASMEEGVSELLKAQGKADVGAEPPPQALVTPNAESRPREPTPEAPHP